MAGVWRCLMNGAAKPPSNRCALTAIYTPPSLEGTLELPGYAGGSNWGGIAFDPESQLVIANVMDAPMLVALVPRNELADVRGDPEYDGFEIARQTGTPYGMRRRPLLSSLGVPCIAPPWGTLAAVDMTAGSIRWQVPLGTIEDIAPAPVPNFEWGRTQPGRPGRGLLVG